MSAIPWISVLEWAIRIALVVFGCLLINWNGLVLIAAIKAHWCVTILTTKHEPPAHSIVQLVSQQLLVGIVYEWLSYLVITSSWHTFFPVSISAVFQPLRLIPGLAAVGYYNQQDEYGESYAYLNNRRPFFNASAAHAACVILKVAVSGQTLWVFVTSVSIDFVSCADNIMGAIAFTAALRVWCFAAFRVLLATLMTVEEVRALQTVTTPREALEIVVAVVHIVLFPVQALVWVHAWIVGAAEACIDAVIINIAKDICCEGDHLIWVRTCC